MSRPPSTQPTDAELGILRILWESGPCELGVICAELRRQREIATTTVATMLRVMLEKGLAKRIEGSSGYLWSAKVSRRATAGRMLRKLLNHVFDGSARLMMMHLIDGETLSQEDLRELRELLKSADDEPRSQRNDEEEP